MKGNSNSKKTTEEKKNEISVSRKNDLLTLLPIEVQQSKELTINHKLVLAYLIEFNNIDKAKDNGYIYRTNDIISQETGVCLNTLRSSFAKLTDLGFIERTAGHRGKASEYRLHMSMIKSYGSKNKSYGSKNKSYGSKNKSYGSKIEDENCTNKLNPIFENCTNKLNPNYNDLLLIINELRNEVKSYRSKVEEYKNEVEEYKMKLHPIFENCTTDTDTDKETDTISKDNLLYNNNTEEYNTRDQNIKEKSTKDNLEILKENSTVEIPNDEDIQRENEILNKIENTSRDNISDDEIPSDLPPLNIDDFFETSNDNLTEYRSNENVSKDENELEFSIFGNDIISEDENDNDTTVKFINGKFTVVSETEDEINSSSDVEQDNDNNSNEISNSTMTMEDNTISNNTISISSDEFQIWGKIQPIFEKTSNKLVEYLFSEYQTIHSQKEIQGTFAQVKRYISLDKEQLNNVSIPSTGTFGILSLKNETYNFIQCNTDPNGKNDNFKRSLNVEKKGGAAVETEKTSNNADTAAKMSQVDNYTTDDKKVAPVQPQTVNNESVDMCYTMYGVTADEMNDILSHHGNYNTKPSKGAWRQMTIHLHGEQTTVSEALNHFKDKKKDGKEYMECNTFLYYFTPICNEVEKLLKTKTMTDEQYQDFLSIIGKLTRGKFAYWRKVFSNREPRPNFPSEQEMWVLLGCPSVTEKTDNKNINNTVDNNKTYEDNVILPTHKAFESMNLDDIKNTLLNFVQEHPNLSDDKKKYINDLCIAYTLDPQYVA